MTVLKPLRALPWLPIGGILLALALLGGAIRFTDDQLRAELRNQFARRDGHLLAALLQQQLAAAPEATAADPLAAVLETTRLPQLPGMLSVSLYDPNGRFTAVLPATASETALDAGLLSEARRTGLSSRFRPDAVLTNELVLTFEGTRPEPVLEVVMPLKDGLRVDTVGYVRFLLKGDSIAGEFAELDANLQRQGWLAFALTGGAMTLVLSYAFRRLAQANRRLRRANHDLILAAKTSAVGAVASHLIHGLKNPLAGLQQFVLGQGESAADRSDAASTARRMKDMIEEVVRVLREDSGLAGYEITTAELLEVLTQRLRPLAAKQRVTFSALAGARQLLPNREANLILLILENLATNALQATPPEGKVAVEIISHGGRLEFLVRDQGAGLSSAVQARLFTPVSSTKPGGSGIGLALSSQLARHLGAELTLVRSDAAGTEFQLSLPPPARRAA